ncbi:helix-turn-helix domain-containing protein [Nonomuraea sp. NPDC050536]|uniref:helix-turn-helix domain-containing protein n=1 Tax=Nonomuraea sp. NPDC050536 TaxID=3364366 RepID=UPI0037C7A879
MEDRHLGSNVQRRGCVVVTFRISEAAALLGVSADTVRRWVDAGRLAAERDEHGHRQVNGADLAAFARAQIEAVDSGHSSARNRFRGIVTEVVRDAMMAQGSRDMVRSPSGEGAVSAGHGSGPAMRKRPPRLAGVTTGPPPSRRPAADRSPDAAAGLHLGQGRAA